MKRWLGIGQVREVLADVVGEAFRKLEQAQQAHISDLRVLIDKAHDREAQLAQMIETVIENRFAVTPNSGKPSENRSNPVIPVENLSDVATFDEDDDAEQIRQQQERENELNQELADLVGEQNAAGIHKLS